jgi:two-component system phosphate regulon sensor histidine kinase PhoR
MTSVLASEISLYELVAGSTSAPFAMQVSPVTFKALMSSLLDLLVEQNDTASVWVKLPKGDAWQTEFDRYLERAGADQQIHCFKNQRDDNPDADLKQAFAGLERTGTNQPSTVLVSPESPLRREYFLLIWSKQFCGLLVGHRARLAPVLREGDTLVQVDEDGTEKKQSLMAFLVVDPNRRARSDRKFTASYA